MTPVSLKPLACEGIKTLIPQVRISPERQTEELESNQSLRAGRVPIREVLDPLAPRKAIERIDPKKGNPEPVERRGAPPQGPWGGSKK